MAYKGEIVEDRIGQLRLISAEGSGKRWQALVDHMIVVDADNLRPVVCVSATRALLVAHRYLLVGDQNQCLDRPKPATIRL